MNSVQTGKQTVTTKRKVVLSPELNEFLHMLKALEGEPSPSGSRT